MKCMSVCRQMCIFSVNGEEYSLIVLPVGNSPDELSMTIRWTIHHQNRPTEATSCGPLKNEVFCPSKICHGSGDFYGEEMRCS